MIIPRLEGRVKYMKDGNTLPFQYFGEQLPPSVTKRKTRNSVNSSKYKLKFRSKYANKSDVADNGDADNDYYDYIQKRKKVYLIQVLLSDHVCWTGYLLMHLFITL